MTGREVSTVAISEPKLEAFWRHESDLTTWDYDGTDDTGSPVARLYPLPRVDRYTKLIPEAECHVLIAQLEAALEPAHYDQARSLARTVIGRYAKRELIDPDVYVVEITRAFAEAPADLGQRSAGKLRSKPFLVNAGDVMVALEPLVAERTRALAQARRHLAEHQRRKVEAAKPKAETYKDLGPAERDAFDAHIDDVRRGGRLRPISEVLKHLREKTTAAQD